MPSCGSQCSERWGLVSEARCSDCPGLQGPGRWLTEGPSKETDVGLLPWGLPPSLGKPSGAGASVSRQGPQLHSLPFLSVLFIRNQSHSVGSDWRREAGQKGWRKKGWRKKASHGYAAWVTLSALGGQVLFWGRRFTIIVQLHFLWNLQNKALLCTFFWFHFPDSIMNDSSLNSNGNLQSIQHFNPYYFIESSYKQMRYIIPIFRLANWGSEAIIGLPKVSVLVSDRNKTNPQPLAYKARASLWHHSCFSGLWALLSANLKSKKQHIFFHNWCEALCMVSAQYYCISKTWKTPNSGTFQMWGCGPAFQYPNGSTGAAVHQPAYPCSTRLSRTGSLWGCPRPSGHSLHLASLTFLSVSPVPGHALPFSSHGALLLVVFVWGIPSPTSPCLTPGLQIQLSLLLSACFLSSKLLLVVLC